jgi:hypothetical protein
MPRLITIDKTVIDQINAGNVGVANFLQRLPRGIGLMRRIRPELTRVLKDPIS